MSLQFHRLPNKIRARNEIVFQYRALTGNLAIPADKEYWTLCHHQYKHQRSEINQMCAWGLIKPEQFHGVDFNHYKIKRNRERHPTAHWHEGDWLDIIHTEKNFRPAIVYLDTQNIAGGKIAYTMLGDTLSRTSRPDCDGLILFWNVAMINPHSGEVYTEEDIVEGVNLTVGRAVLSYWKDNIENYVYRGSRTPMRTYIFVRKQ
jgi:hypothetical protein